MNLRLARPALCTLLIALLLCPSAQAHGGQAGDIVITHPFATPTPPGARNGAAYFVTLENTGKLPDRLLSASTPVAQSIEIHTMSVDSGGVMRMRELPDIALPPGQPLKMRPGGGLHLMLVGLKQPLVAGDTFVLTLRFERGGRTEVKVVVQVPKPRTGDAAAHQH